LRNHFPVSIAEIHLESIKKNITIIQQKATARKVLAVVKCDAYRHGAVTVSKFIEGSVDWFAVASVDEGIELRMGGIKKPVLVFGVPTYENAAAYQTHNLTATISDVAHFSVLMDGTSYQLNFDTGMGRLGFSPAQAADIRQLAIASQRLACSGIYSHYATADDPGSDYVYIQQQRFKQVLTHFPEIPLIHMSNTGAATNYDDIDHFGMIRTGLGMMGYNAGYTRHSWLTPALTWKTKAAQVRPIKRGDVVSYSSTWVCPEDGFLATLPVGYADGVPRSLSNKLHVLINDTYYRQAGNITMDMTMVFLGKDNIAQGSDVILLGGSAWNAYEWAEHGQTNVHEILTNITPRVEKVYI